MNHTLKFALAATIGFTGVLALAPGAQAASTIRSRALSTAAAQKGDPYRYGAAGPDAFDCSGLTYYSYRKNGKTLPRTAQGQYNHSTHVSPSNRQKGDLIFIGTSSGSIYHVGIYAGVWRDSHGTLRGWMWDAPRTGSTVGAHPIYWYTYGSPKAYYGRIYG
jgi:cell wall-associated NlpC family hydrolase